MISIATRILLLTVGTVPLVALRDPQNTVSNRTVIELSLASYTSAPGAIVMGSLGMGTSIDSIWISMKDLRFRSKSKRADPTYAEGPITAELVHRFVSGLPESAVVDSGRYAGFELRLRRSKGQSRGAPFDLRGASVVVEGCRDDGIRFIIRARLDSVLALHADTSQGFPLFEGTPLLFLAVDAARWMANINLATAEILHDGVNEVIRVDESSNTKLLVIFRKNLSPGLGLFRDVDGDGAFGPADRGTRGKLASGRP